MARRQRWSRYLCCRNWRFDLCRLELPAYALPPTPSARQKRSGTQPLSSGCHLGPCASPPPLRGCSDQVGGPAEGGWVVRRTTTTPWAEDRRMPPPPRRSFARAPALSLADPRRAPPPPLLGALDTREEVDAAHAVVPSSAVAPLLGRQPAPPSPPQARLQPRTGRLAAAAAAPTSAGARAAPRPARRSAAAPPGERSSPLAVRAIRRPPQGSQR